MSKAFRFSVEFILNDIASYVGEEDNVWEYTCVNWIRTSPYVKAWNRDYRKLGLVVIGMHAPEFEFGKLAENIDRGIRDHGLTYPIALDNDFAVWRALGNDAWPAAARAPVPTARGRVPVTARAHYDGAGAQLARPLHDRLRHRPDGAVRDER